MPDDVNIRSVHVVVDAPPEAVFDFIDDLLNLPRWCIHFCKGIRFIEDGAMVQTSSGEVYFWITPDRETGVLDWWSGATQESAERWPTRVVGLADGRTLYEVTAIFPAGANVQKAERWLTEELGMLKRLVEEEVVSRV